MDGEKTVTLECSLIFKTTLVTIQMMQLDIGIQSGSIQMTIEQVLFL
jgi:hypothetical protein